jgi:septal ring factor EnvC (AmiA/AmiB activator)
MNAGRICLVVLFLLFTVTAFPQKTQKSKSQLQKEKQQNLEKIKETERILQETSNRKKNSLGELSALNQRITQQESLITSITDELRLLDADIGENQELVSALEKDVADLKKEYATMIFSAQKAGGRINKLTFLFSASSFDQFIMRLRYMKQYGKARQEQAAAIARFQELLEGQIRETETIRAAKNTLLIEGINENKNLASLKDKQKVLVRTLQKEERRLKSDLEDTRKAVAQLDAFIEEIVREEIARAEREAREAKRKAAASKANESAAVLSSSFEDNKKKFGWPASGFISQKFGKQPHPALKGIVINNNGINIQTKQDEKVKCIFNGEVRKVALIGVLGNSVIINHGDYFSVYAGLKEVFVKRGDQVTTNQEIGQVHVNSEGVSELKFMIYKNNTALDPQLWLKN